MSFHIEWSLTDDEWDYALETYRSEPAAGLYDGTGGALYHLLHGNIQLPQDDELLFPEPLLRAIGDLQLQITAENSVISNESDEEFRHGAYRSLADIGYQFIHNINTQRFQALDDGASLQFVQRSGDLIIYFQKVGESVKISSNHFVDVGVLPEDHGIVVRHTEFFAGVDAFLKDFGSAMHRFVPGLFQWSTFRRFGNYLLPK